MKAILTILVLLLAACGTDSSNSVADTTIPSDSTSDTIAPLDTAIDTPGDMPTEPPWEFTPPSTPLVPTELSSDLPANVEGIVFDGGGSLFLSGMDGVVHRVNSDGTVSAHASLLPIDGAGGDVAGMARGPDGDLYVCRYSAGRIERIHGDPPTVEVFADGLDHPNSMAFASDGALWYTASGSGADAPGHVGRIPGDGAPEILIEDIVYANGLAFSPDHSWVWITSTDPGSLLRAPLGTNGLPEGELEIIAEGPELAVADGLAVAPDGTVFVAGFGTGRIYAWHDDSLVTVAEAEAPPGIAGVASLAFGVGEGFSETALYATNLLQPKLVVIELMGE